MGIGHGRGWVGWNAALRAWMVCLSCGFSAVAWAQSATDGAIGGRVLNVAGAPVTGARVMVREMQTGLALDALSGAHGEFLVVRLPVGEYVVTVEDSQAVLTLAGPVEVALGEVTEVEARMGSATSGQGSLPGGAGAAGARLSEADLVGLPVDGEWRSLAVSADGMADGDGGLSFRGTTGSQNSERTDGMSGEQSFAGARLGAGVEEDTDAGSDEVYDRAAGVGSGSRSVADGGQRAGSTFAFSQAAVREFRVQGQSDAAAYGSALYGHGVGGVVTTVSRSGGTTLHGMAFFTMRDSSWAAANPFSVASTYANGVVTSGVVKPLDVREQFGGSMGGPVRWKRDRGVVRTATDQKQQLFFPRSPRRATGVSIR